MAAPRRRLPAPLALLALRAPLALLAVMALLARMVPTAPRDPPALLVRLVPRARTALVGRQARRALLRLLLSNQL